MIDHTSDDTRDELNLVGLLPTTELPPWSGESRPSCAIEETLERCRSGRSRTFPRREGSRLRRSVLR